MLTGRALYHWLGDGIYGYLVCDNAARGRSAALLNAKTFVESRGEQSAGFVAVQVAAKQPLDLQYPEIFEAHLAFAEVMAERMKKVGLWVEENRDWVRSEANFKIDGFTIVTGALSDKPIDVVRSQFTGRSTPTVESLLNPEICIKDNRSIVSYTKISSGHDIPLDGIHCGEWVPSNALLKAAQQSAQYLKSLDDAQFADLIFKIAEGADSILGGARRFSPNKSISLAVVKPGPASAEVEKVLQNSGCRIGQTLTVLECDTLRDLPGPEAARRIDKALTVSKGLIAIADAPDVELSSIIRRAQHHRMPIVILTTKEAAVPHDLRSMKNVSIFTMPPKRQRQKWLEDIATGFLTDDWKANSEHARVRLMLAARGCKRETLEAKIDRHADIRKIIEKDTKNFVSPELSLSNTSEGRWALSDLPTAPEEAASDVRRQIGVNSSAITTAEMLTVVEPYKLYRLNIAGSGYLLPMGPLGSYNIVALAQNDRDTRQRFTLAHEIGHAVLDASVFRYAGDEEAYCDQFAVALLMPLHEVIKFAKSTISLHDWLAFPTLFDVSLMTAQRRIWETNKKLLVSPSAPWPKDCPDDATRSELLAIAAKLMRWEQRSGELANGAPFAARRTIGESMAIADLAASRALNAGKR